MKLVINIHFPHEFYNSGDIACLIRNISILYGKCQYELNLFNSQHQENKIYKYILKKSGRTNITKTEELKQFFKVNILKSDTIYGGEHKVIFSKCGELIYVHITDDNTDYIFDILKFFSQKRNVIKNKLNNNQVIIYVDNIQYYPNLAFIKKISSLHQNILFKIQISNNDFTMKNTQENRIKNICDLFVNSHNVCFVDNLTNEIKQDYFNDNRKYYLVDMDETAVPCETVKIEGNVGLIFGSESNGISKEVYETIYKNNYYQKIMIESKAIGSSGECFDCSSMNLSVAIFCTLSMIFA